MAVNPLWPRLQNRSLLRKWRDLAQKGRMMRLECGRFRVAEVSPPRDFDARHLPYALSFGQAQGTRYIPTPEKGLYLAHRNGQWFVALAEGEA